MTEPTNILLITRDGYAAHIGDDEQLRAKIGTVRAVIEDLKRRDFQVALLKLRCLGGNIPSRNTVAAARMTQIVHNACTFVTKGLQ